MTAEARGRLLRLMPAPITTDLVWQEVEKRLFAVLSWVNPSGHARSAGIVYLVKDRALYVATNDDSWKAKHIRSNPHVALNVTIPKRIPFMPWVKIPDATIAFSATARVMAATETEPEIIEVLMRGMAEDPERLARTCVLEIRPSGHFATYGVGIPLLDMRDPKKARGRAPVG
ncbi:MAG: pyridoxamine 5'-phosphate oxidase family protein [Polyangiales bacterium]